MIPRPSHLALLRQQLADFPVVAILGPRQVGKTTLARALEGTWSAPVKHFDLEDPDDQARLSDAAFILRSLKGLVVLDEIQLRPDLFPLLRVLADRPDQPARFLILGSAAPELLKSTAETLAGRVVFHELEGLTFEEIAASSGTTAGGLEWLDKRWLRGGFPRSFLARDIAVSRQWRDAFIRTYLERDLPQLGIQLPSTTMRRFWSMLAHYHGQTWNGSELARALAVSDKTVSRYLDILEGTFMAFRLLPWHANQGKREIKSPKVYLSDSGVLHSLLGISGHDELLGHPKSGASWEGLLVGEIIHRLKAQRHERFFWGVHAGAGLDLLIRRGGKQWAFEIKLTHSPSITPSMRSAVETLNLDHLYVVFHGDGDPMPLAEKITAVPASHVASQQFERLLDAN